MLVIDLLHRKILFQTYRRINITIDASTITSPHQGIPPPNYDTSDCYEPILEYHGVRQNARYWLEGILIFIVGVIGIFGNVLSIVVLRRCPVNRSFNGLLI